MGEKQFSRLLCKRFTLIEMLVVIAIIGILASMLMPSLQSAIETTRVLSCTSNLKQIGVSMAQYAEDNSSSLPAYRRVNNRGIKDSRCWGFGNWPLELLLASYMNVETPAEWRSSGTGLFLCPSSGTEMKQDMQYYYPGDSSAKSENNYSGLLFHYDRGFYGEVKGLTSVTNFKSPARSPFQFCSRYCSPASTVINGWLSTYITAPSWHGSSIMPPRPTVFIDGHAKSLVDPQYTLGQNDLPNWRDAWKLIVHNPRGSMNPAEADVYLEEY